MAERTSVFNCPKSAGQIRITKSGNGNSTSYKISADGGQFDYRPGEPQPRPLEFEVIGEWELEELATALADEACLEVVDPTEQPDLVDPVQLRQTFLALLDQSEAAAEVVADELLRLLLGHAMAYGLDVAELASRMVEYSSNVSIVPMPPGGDA